MGEFDSARKTRNRGRFGPHKALLRSRHTLPRTYREWSSPVFWMIRGIGHHNGVAHPPRLRPSSWPASPKKDQRSRSREKTMPVRKSSFQKFIQPCMIGLISGDDQLPAFVQQDLFLFTVFGQQTITPPSKLGLETVGRVIESGMQDPAVAATRVPVSYTHLTLPTS